jgi:DNA modification methylase
MFIDLRCGDSLEVLKTVPDDSIDLVVTSPPYYNAREYSSWDTYESYIEWLTNVFTLIYRKLKDGRMCCVNISVIIDPRLNRQSESRRIPIPFHFVCLAEKIGYKFLEDIIWVKPEGAAKNRNGGFYRSRQPVQYKPNIVNEYILVFQKSCNFLIDNILRSYSEDIKTRSYIGDDYDRSNVWYMQPETSSEHPAPYPVELCNKLIRYYSFVNDVVLDPFMGSGTTGVACKLLDRNFIGIELVEDYYNIAKDRIDSTLHQISLF